MIRRLVLLAFLSLAGCHHNLSAQDVNVRGLIPPLAFNMTDTQTGAPVTARDFKGKVTLLFFGYTNCPDECPATMYNLTRIFKLLERDRFKMTQSRVTLKRESPSKPLMETDQRLRLNRPIDSTLDDQAPGPVAAHIQVLFVTVDPGRDTAQVLNRYTALFGPNFIGLRGSANQLYELARRYRVVFTVVKKPVYSVTHSAAVYVFNAQGQARFIIGGLDTNRPDLKGIAADLSAVARE